MGCVFLLLDDDVMQRWFYVHVFKVEVVFIYSDTSIKSFHSLFDLLLSPIGDGDVMKCPFVFKLFRVNLFFVSCVFLLFDDDALCNVLSLSNCFELIHFS